MLFRTQIHGGLRKKTYEASGIPLPHSEPQQTSGQQQQTVLVVQQPSVMTGNPAADVTLNMLNASESEVDVEGLNFEGANEVVPT